MQGIDTVAVSAWLDANVDGATSPYQFTLIVGGRSNLTFAVRDRDGRRYVLVGKRGFIGNQSFGSRAKLWPGRRH